MTLAELAAALKTLNMPVAYDHFDSDDNNPYPDPPFLVYLYAYSNDLYADDVNYKSIDDIQIELYTDKKDVAAEQKVESKLTEIRLPYSKIGTWIDSEKLYQMIYDVTL